MTTDGVYVYAIIRREDRCPRPHGVGSPAAHCGSSGRAGRGCRQRRAPEAARPTTRPVGPSGAFARAWPRAARSPHALRDGGTGRGDGPRSAGSRHGPHLATLERLSGRVEVNVKALPAQNGLAALLREDEKVRQLRAAAVRRPGYEANLRLGEAVAAALSRRAAEAGRRLIRELTPLARAVATGPEVDGCVLNVSFLVDRGIADRFRMAAQTAPKPTGNASSCVSPAAALLQLRRARGCSGRRGA